jgi:hypothetical protein
MKSVRTHHPLAKSVVSLIVITIVAAALFISVVSSAQKRAESGRTVAAQGSAPMLAGEMQTPGAARPPVQVETAAQESSRDASASGVTSRASASLMLPQTVKTARPAPPAPESIDVPAPDTAASYVFATATNGSFTDMSTGTTQLVAAGLDDASSAVTNLGFDFYFLGTRYTQFSVNSNGYMRLGGTVVATSQYTLGSAAVPLITAMGSDLEVSTTGKVHYKVTGSAPNRVLTVEWLNMTIIYDATAVQTNGTYQVRIKETTGVVELVYGSMARNSSTGFGGGMDAQYIGFSINSTATNFASIDTANNNSTATLAANQFTLGANMASLNSPGGDGNRRIYTYTPPVPTAPTAINFTGVTQTAMNVNWTDSPDDAGYVIYRSTDGINYSFAGQVATNSVTFAASGLNPSTTYFWQVYAISDGAQSAALSGSQATLAPGNIVSTAVGGLWSVPATWAGGAVPTNGDNVTIADGATVTIDTAAVALNVTVGQGATGILQWDTASARTLTVGQAVTIASGGIFRTGAALAVNTHVLTVGTDLTNNGTLDFSTTGSAANSCRAGITFTGAANNTFGGTGGTTDISTLTMNKGTSSANILELNTTNFTVQGTNTDGAPMAFLTLTNGTLKVSGTFAITGRVFTAAGYTIPAAGGFWLNNPNFTVAAQNGSPTEAGLLRISQGTYNIGTATGNAMGFSTGSTITVEGGAINGASRFGVAAATNTITYTQSAGTITVNTVANTSATLGSFDLGTSATSNISVSGGTVICQLQATAIDYRYDSGGTLGNLTGGTVQFGNASSGAAKTFSARGVAFNYVVNTTSAGHTVNLSTTLVNWNHVAFGITIGAGGTFTCGNTIFFIEGNVVNNGTLNATTAGCRLYNAASGAQTYSGGGTFTAAAQSIELDNANGLTLSTTNQIPTLRVILFTGGVTGAGKLTIGNGAGGTVQIGNGAAATAAGTFDVSPTYNLGGTGETLFLLRTGADRNTGFEINPTRSVLNMTVDPNGNTFNLAGGDLTVTGTTTINTGFFSIGANTLTITNAIAGTLPAGLLGGATSSLVINGGVASNVPSSITQLNNFTLNNAGGSTLQGGLTIGGTLTLSNGALSIAANTLGINGPISVATGTLTGGATSIISVGGAGASTTLPAVAGGLLRLTLNRANGLTLGAPLSVTTTLELFAGTLGNGANNVTLGNGALINVSGGSLAAAPVFGTTVNVTYSSVGPISSGFEIPVSLTVLNNLNESGIGDVTLTSSPQVNGTLTLNGGNFITGANVVIVRATGSVSRTSGYVDGNLARTFSGAGTLNYDIGAGGGYSPVSVNALSLSLPQAILTIKAVNSSIGGLTSLQSLQRNWVFSSSPITKATLTFTYVGGDVPGGANTAIWRVVRKLSSDQRFTFPNGNTDNVNEGSNTATATSVTMPAFGGTYTVTQSNAPGFKVNDPRPAEVMDFDGSDARTDVTAWNGTTGDWTIINSFDNTQRVRLDWGKTALGDVLVPGDYDGDGRADITVWRPSDGNWYITRSSDNVNTTINWGGTGDVAVPGDYDGDGKTDVAVFRPSEGNWYIVKSSGGVIVQNWGIAGDLTVPADYDGDGKTDIAVWRPSDGNWYVIKSSNSSLVVTNWGLSGDKVLPGDFDGDGKADRVIYRPSENNWYVLNSSDGTYQVVSWGLPGDVLVPGDYDRDGRIDFAVYRPSEGNWYILRSGDSSFALKNLVGDVAVPSVYVRP